ncbi:MAG: clan AA aspartic protease [Gallionella sp.]|nr:clan AA aspartic protease [Gallionella sp.]
MLGIWVYQYAEGSLKGRAAMGHIFASIELSNPRKPELRPMSIRALADTGALMLCLPEHIALQLDLQTESLREVTVADGRSMNVPYVGPVKVSFENRICFVGALVLGDEALLGAVQMEDMDLLLSPSRQSIVVNPSSPNIPHARVK